MAESRLQREIAKRKPFDSLEQETMLNVWRTGDAFDNRFGKLFREYGLTASQYNVLRILQGEGRPLPSLEIARRTIQVVPAITGLIDRLLKAGLVRRERSEEDRRVVLVELTPAAEALLETMAEPVLELHRELVGHLTKTELRTLNQLLEKARASLDETMARAS